MYTYSYDSLDSSLWTIIPETQGSDYSGSSATRANYEWFRDNYTDSDDLAIVSGWFFGYAIAYRTAAYTEDTMDTEIKEIIDALCDYPVICDETMYRVETSWVQDALSDWTILDFKRAVERLTGRDDLWDEVDESTVRIVFDECMLRSGEDWTFEHTTAWIDVEKIAKQFESVISSIDDIRACFKA